MSASTATQMPFVSPAEMQVLVSRAGLTLNPGQMADLVLAWRQLAGLLVLIPRDRPMTDDQAYVFRLPPPLSAAGSAPDRAPVPTRAPERNKTPNKARATAKPVPRKTTKKPAPARASKKVAARKTVRRKR